MKLLVYFICLLNLCLNLKQEREKNNNIQKWMCTNWYFNTNKINKTNSKITKKNMLIIIILSHNNRFVASILTFSRVSFGRAVYSFDMPNP